MYIENNGGYYKGSEQHARRGLFLMLVQPPGIEGGTEIKAVVRKVALSQLGAWMMGRVSIYGHRLSVSGSYGSDGLPMNVPQEVYDRLQVKLPQYLYDAWNKGGGWNSAGNEAELMREWAKQNLATLTK